MYEVGPCSHGHLVMNDGCEQHEQFTVLQTRPFSADEKLLVCKALNLRDYFARCSIVVVNVPA